jgi:hypothetical protein
VIDRPWKCRWNRAASLEVNSSEKVADLNADQLVGKSEADFYAAGGKVADSELLDGKDSDDFHEK